MSNMMDLIAEYEAELEAKYKKELEFEKSPEGVRLTQEKINAEIVSGLRDQDGFRIFSEVDETEIDDEDENEGEDDV